jgi:ABC-type lipoprotein export system ATPase subunit
MMPGLIHVSGPSGSGKTTLMGMLSNPNLVIMDTDAVTDPIWREA